MKTTLKIACVAAAMAVAGTNALANPRAAEAAGSDFPIAASSLDGFHVGGFYRYQSRDILHDTDRLSQDAIAFHAGVDVVRWLSVYGFIGTVDTEFESKFRDADMAAIYGGGAWVNILDHELLTSLTVETKIRLQACAQASFAKPEVNGEDCGYTDYYGNITFSIINEIVGNRFIFPDEIGIFVGPSFSKFECDDIDTTGSNIGVIFGIDMIVSRNVSLSASYETYDSGDDAINISINCRF